MTYSHAHILIQKQQNVHHLTTVNSAHHVPYLPRARLPSRKHQRAQVKRMQVPTRRVVFVLFLLSFIPYFVPDKPSVYRSKNATEIETIRRDRYIGGKIDDLPWTS